MATSRALLETIPSTLPPHLRAQLRSGRELADLHRRKDPASVLPTRIAALDELLDGGLARGQLVELMGRRSSGRFSTVLSVLAATTTAAEAVALVDLGDHLSPRLAREAGATLERILWLRPRDMKEALAGTEVVLQCEFPVVILELGTPPLRGGKGTESSWLRLARAARAHRTALLVSSPYRVTGTAAAVVLQARRRDATWSGKGNAPRLLAGLGSRLVLEKCPGQAAGRETEVALRVGGCPQASNL